MGAQDRPGGRDESTEMATTVGRGQLTGRVRRFALSVVEGPDAGQKWQSTGSSCSIGSEASNDLVLSDPTVSRYHCELTTDESGARLRDLGSRNGSVLDGVVVVEAMPRHGSLIRLGDSVVRLDLEDAHNQLPLSDRETFGGLVGRSPAMRGVFAILERAAASSATVLIEGETGTGKEAAARSIHDASSRRDAPYVIVDCGALPATLLESELFGHEKGAFTGAAERRIGAFEAAHGGTIFLDEIGELPLDLQPKLLRVLESRQIRRIGNATHREIDFRVLAATNRDLRAEVNAGRFRSDVYFRLGVVRVRIPPLRERPEDIPILAEHIVRTIDATDAERAPFLAPAFLGRLTTSAWSGNVRELRNYLEQCVVLQHASLTPESSASTAGAAPLPVDARQPYAEERRRILDEFERAYIEKALELAGGNVSRAARTSGLGRVYFYELINKHKLR